MIERRHSVANLRFRSIGWCQRIDYAVGPCQQCGQVGRLGGKLYPLRRQLVCSGCYNVAETTMAAQVEKVPPADWGEKGGRR